MRAVLLDRSNPRGFVRFEKLHPSAVRAGPSARHPSLFLITNRSKPIATETYSGPSLLRIDAIR